MRGKKNSTASQVAKIDSEIAAVEEKLERYYQAFESGDLEAIQLHDRVSALKSRLTELSAARVNAKASSGARSMSAGGVQSYVGRLRETLEAADPNERKTVLRSFVEQVRLDGEEVTVEYHLPSEGQIDSATKVLPIVPSGGAEGIRTELTGRVRTGP